MNLPVGVGALTACDIVLPTTPVVLKLAGFTATRAVGELDADDVGGDSRAAHAVRPRITPRQSTSRRTCT